MKTINTTLAASLAISLGSSWLLAGLATAQPAPPGDAFILQMMGERGWQVSCELGQSDGDTVTTRERGRGLHDNGRFLVSDVTSGSCSYDVPDRGMLRVTLETRRSGLECPFTETEDGFCRANFSAGQSGRFEIRRQTVPASPSIG